MLCWGKNMSNAEVECNKSIPQTVSLCIVAYNEEYCLPNLLRDLSNQTYPHELIEVVLIDSCSADSTKKMMTDFAEENTARFSSVNVLDNEKGIQAAGWNVALMSATGDVIIRIDAHASITPEFTARNMQSLQSGEYVSGGIRTCLIEGESAWRRILLKTENSMFGSSIAKSKSGMKKEYVKTLFHAAYRREVFADSGGFNENLLRTEDNEIHYRIRQAGYRFCFDPDIKSYQYSRSSLKKMIKQKYGNGYWVGLTAGICPGCISVYNFVPFAFVLGIVFTAMLVLIHIWQLAAIMWTLYLMLGSLSVAEANRKETFQPLSLLMPGLFLILHVSYGIGTLIGLIMIPWKRKNLQDCPNIEMVKNHMKNRVRSTVQ